MYTKNKRMISGFLAAVMLLGLIPAAAFAAEETESAGLCEHHPAHTAQCGYVPASEGSPCSHEHTEDCYALVEHCTHQHTELCMLPPAEEEGGETTFPAPTTEEDGGIMEGAPSMSTGQQACTHQCSVGSGCLEQVLLCTHAHDVACGYTPATEGSPCTYACLICFGEEEAVFPQSPGLPEGPGPMEPGQMLDGLYGQPTAPMSIQELSQLQALSLSAPTAEAVGEEITADELDGSTFIYINGEAYQGGALTVYQGDNFSYMTAWAPHHETGDPDVMKWDDGDWFEVDLFQVPGLSLPSAQDVPLSINGIRVGDYSITYNSQSGAMTYKVVFNRYIQFFAPTSIMAYVQGSGSFNRTLENGDISIGDDSGSLTVIPRPTVPGGTSGQGGTVWKPTTAPGLNGDVYPFGKGVKWNNSNAQHTPADQIEWRVVFLEQLQKLQLEFREAWLAAGSPADPQKVDFEFPISEGYIIIEDTLDVNQRFYKPESEQTKYGKSPFFLEVPVMVPGTGAILNSTYDVGNGSYDGPGEIHTYIPGGPAGGPNKNVNIFQEIEVEPPREGETLQEKNKEAQDTVRETPLSWVVTTDPTTTRQTLLINAGKLGTTDPTEGITWKREHINNYDRWPTTDLEKEIQNCQNRIDALQVGTDSPIALFEQRATALLNKLNTVVNLPENAERLEELKTQVDSWHANYVAWREHPETGYLKPLAKESEPGVWELIISLPDKALIEALGDVPAGANKTVLRDTVEYKNYLLSLNNLQADQRVYLENRLQYGKDWEARKQAMECALAFYQHFGVYGFAVKIRTESINSSVSTFHNSAKVSLDDRQWSAEDNTEVKFQGGIVGSYNVGDVVLQKADAFYDTENVEADIHQLEQEKLFPALSGAVFRMYCEDTAHPDVEQPHQEDEHLAHFLDKDASPNQSTYYYTHTGDTHSPGTLHGEISDLETDAKGRLALGRIVPSHRHWLVETRAPAGYYRDETPILLDTDRDKVNYHLMANVSRSVILHKTDSFSKNPVQGAEFELVQVKDGMEETVTGFEIRTQANANGDTHTGYWKTEHGTAALKTDENGVLCIHGLDAGEYILKETQPAPGYLEKAQGATFSFTLEEELPELSGQRQQTYDDLHHLLLTSEDTPLTNDPGVASLTLKKTGADDDANGTPDPLSGAAFTLFRFKGTEADWKEEPDKETLWEPVALNSTEGPAKEYFRTEQSIDSVQVEGQGLWADRDLPAAVTGENGALTITDIPLGHYSIAEVQAPAGYQRDYRSFYFTVNSQAVKEATDDKAYSVQLYTKPVEPAEPLTGNTLQNYKLLAQLALVKYDSADDKPPEIAGGQFDPNDPSKGWHYTEGVVEEPEQANGLGGASFKLFMRRGASGEPNPHPDELSTPKLRRSSDPGYDLCLAVGSTENNGVLKLSGMTNRDDKPIDGLNPGEYYLIEVAAPEGYLLDQTPIEFSLVGEEIFNDQKDQPPGLVKAVSNRQVVYGARLRKVAAETPEEGRDGGSPQPKGLAGAVFQVAEQGQGGTPGQPLSFTVGSSIGTYQLAEEGTTAKYTTTELVTGPEGELTVTGLTGGATYLFTELRSPRGYAMPEDEKDRVVEITVPKTAGGEPDEGILVGDVLYPQVTPTVANKQLKGEVTLHKQAAETQLPLAGAKFALMETIVEVIPPDDPAYDPELPGGTRTYDVKCTEGTTDSEGNLTFKDLDWGNYYLIELEPPKRYLLDQTKLSFSINESSFSADGKPIVVQFPAVVNAQGVLGPALLVKVDAEDPDTVLEDAHFYLMKYAGLDAAGEAIWVGYGEGMYKTDEDGEIRFLLPPGEYMLTEMKAPAGYVPEGREIRFTIEEPEPGKEPELVIIDEENSADGVVTNQKGDAGLHIRKTLGASDHPVPGVTFEIGWEIFTPGKTTSYYPLSFIDLGGGNYQYTDDPKAEGAITELVTNENGMIYAMMPAALKDSPPAPGLASLYYRESAAPDGLEKESERKPFTLVDGIYTVVSVSNKLKQEVEEELSITIHKKDGKGKTGLAGATFELYWYDGTGEDLENSHLPVGQGTTDEHGTLVFNNLNVLFGLIAGDTYHIVETKAPDGYVLDETHHEVILDTSHFDENFHFTGADLYLDNYTVQGGVRLRKVDADTGKGLAGAEFELLHKAVDADPMDLQWEHYGEDRYVTDGDGRLHIEHLPQGSYQLVERAAPLGYRLGEPAPTLTFQITEETNGQTQYLGEVENEADPSLLRGSVTVQKVAEDTKRTLAGAQFRLYTLAADGAYHPRQRQIYVTDARGRFVIKDLPVGNYALEEIKSPAGYELPEETMTYFAVTPEDTDIRLRITNARVRVPVGPGGPSEPDDPEEPTPSPTPTPPVEPTIPPTPTIPVEPTLPPEPNAPVDPGEPSEPGDSDSPDGSPEPAAPAVPDDFSHLTDQLVPGGWREPGDMYGPGADHLPQTGDNTHLALWAALMCLSAVGFVLVWIKTGAGRKHKRHK